ncbi:hypothetical protein CBER1_07828 [Cercospora berteroae]|uniref:Uncharacterized protein n=1 Tax=Cercospora berteroae TaxID=357750 RepID=A0A2S6BU65_9PEZI|nr:hypothetical protein CBER1_07828 [Cercospora berteroae]
MAQKQPLVNTMKGYERDFAAPAPLTSMREAEALLARNRELVDDTLWLVSEYYLTVELLDYQRKVTNNNDLTIKEVEEGIKKALRRCARLSGIDENKDVGRFRYESCKRRIANLEARLVDEPDLEQYGLNDLKAMVRQLRYHDEDEEGRKRVTFFDRDEIHTLPPVSDDAEDNPELDQSNPDFDPEVSAALTAPPATTAAAKPTRRYNRRGAAPRPNPDMPKPAVKARYGTQAAQIAERTSRFEDWAPRVSWFANRTEHSRQWVGFRKARRNVRNDERNRLRKEIPRLEEELAKCRKELVKMKEADEMEERLYGDRMRQGQQEQNRLDAWDKFLNLESDVEPELDEYGYVLASAEGDKEGGAGEGEGEGEVEMGGVE